jgi:hypothetical protein
MWPQPVGRCLTKYGGAGKRHANDEAHAENDRLLSGPTDRGDTVKELPLMYPLQESLDARERV